jgi:hypothetical protein
MFVGPNSAEEIGFSENAANINNGRKQHEEWTENGAFIDLTS